MIQSDLAQSPSNATASPGYTQEVDLVREFAETISEGADRIKCQAIGFEFAHSRGRTDIIGITAGGELVAFEGKLEKWQKALDQARRNTAFAHYSYVLLPHERANPALQNRKDFQRVGVGLVLMRNGKPKVTIRAKRQKPLLPWLTSAAKSAIIL